MGNSKLGTFRELQHLDVLEVAQFGCSRPPPPVLVGVSVEAATRQTPFLFVVPLVSCFVSFRSVQVSSALFVCCW